MSSSAANGERQQRQQQPPAGEARAGRRATRGTAVRARRVRAKMAPAERRPQLLRGVCPMGAASRPAQATRARRRGTAEAKKLVKRGAHRFSRFAQPGKAAGARGTNRVRRRKQAQKRKRSAAQEAGGAGNRRLPGDGTSGPVKKLRIPRKWEKWESNVRPPRAWGTALKGCQIIHVVQDSESKKASSPPQTRPKYPSLARSLPPPFPLVASSPLPIFSPPSLRRFPRPHSPLTHSSPPSLFPAVGLAEVLSSTRPSEVC